MSSNYGAYDGAMPNLTSDQRREFDSKRLDRKRWLRMGYSIAGAAESPEQEAYIKTHSKDSADSAITKTRVYWIPLLPLFLSNDFRIRSKQNSLNEPNISYYLRVPLG